MVFPILAVARHRGLRSDPAPAAVPAPGIGRTATVPFVATALAAVVVGLAAVETSEHLWLLAAMVCSGLSGVALLAARRGAGGVVGVLSPLLTIASIALIRHATGGATSPFASLLLLPVLWTAIHGDRRSLVVVLAAVAAVVALPAIVVGPPSYPASELRRLLIFVGVAFGVGHVVRDLVGRAETALDAHVRSSAALTDERDQTAALLDAASDAVLTVDEGGRIIRANEAAVDLLGRADLVGQHALGTLIAAPDRERVRAAYRRLAEDTPDGRPTSRFEADLLAADGTTVPAAIVVVRTRGLDGPLVHAFVQDLRARRAAEQGSRDHLEDLQALLGTTKDLARSGIDGPAVICATACRLSGADFAVLYTLDADARRFAVAASAGRHIPPGDHALDGDRSIASMVLRERRTYVIGDLAADDRIDQSLVARLGAGAALWQPIGEGLQDGGVLIAYWREPIARLPQRTITLFELFAVQAAAAMERAHLLAQLESLVRTDALTGAANRRSLDEALARATADARRTGRPLAIVLLDLDHFKRFNDAYGHLAGDELLRSGTAAWQRELRPSATLARFGGEEFVVVLPECDGEAAVAVADRLRSALPPGMTASAGVAVWDGTEGIEALIARGDRALYAAKRTGRDRSVLAEPPSPTAVGATFAIPVHTRR